jgi:hypothetical protein
VPIFYGLYMAPPEMARQWCAVEGQRQRPASIRLLAESPPGLRALMPSGRARLIGGLASQALVHSRIWARRSDLSPPHDSLLASCGRRAVLPRLVTAWGAGGCLTRRPERPARAPSAPRRSAHGCWPRPQWPGSSPDAPAPSGPLGSGGRAAGLSSADHSWPHAPAVDGDHEQHVC